MSNNILLFILVLSLSSHVFGQKPKDPQIVLEAANGNTVSRAKLISDPKIVDKNNGYDVTSFVLTFVPDGRDIIGPFTTKGNELTANELDVLKRMQVPAKIVIEDIRATGSDGFPRTCNTIFLKVTD